MHQAQHALRSAIAALRGPQLALLVLALALALLWFGPAALALAVPFALMMLPRKAGTDDGTRGHAAPSGQAAEMVATLDDRLRRARRERRPVVCATLVIKGFDEVQGALRERLVTSCLDRLAHGLRQDDVLFNLGGGRFGVIPDGAQRLDAPAAHRLTTRLQAHAATALAGIRGTEHLTIVSGFCVETQPGMRSARAMIADSLAATASDTASVAAPRPSSDAS